MKKSPLHFLGRKSQSLFDTNVKMKDMDNMDWVLASSAIPESGTASVRARPTVKHHASSYESSQGFAVPTPKVPLLPPVNGPKINGSVGGGQLSNGSVLSVPDLVEDEIFVPRHPSMAPPPPPGTFIPPSGTFIPPPDFMGDLSTLNLATPSPPSMPAPNLPSLVPSMQEQDLTFLKPPPMAPPKPPSTCSSGSASSTPISNPPSSQVPHPPRFSPPQPPTERQHKAHKTPPPKPIRLSSMSNNDSPPQTPAPPPPVQTPTLSTFNPQQTAKLYNAPTSVLKGHEEPDPRLKQTLFLDDSSPVKTSVLAEVDSKTPQVATPSKPVAKNVQELNDHLQVSQSLKSPLPEPNKEAQTAKVSPPPVDKPVRNSNQTSLQKVSNISINSEASPSQSRKFSPLIDRKLRNLKNSETNGAKEGAAASPLALLMAAKKREKHRTTLSRENSAKKEEQPSAEIQTNDMSTSFLSITPRSSSSSSLASQERVQESPDPNRHVGHTQTTQTAEKSSSSVPAKDKMPSISLGNSQKPSLTNHVVQKHNPEQSRSTTNSPRHEDYKEELSLPLLPPPPEFDDLDDIVGPPPSIAPPDPPRKMAPTPTLKSFPLAKAPSPPLAPPPPPPPPPKPPQALKLPSPDNDFKARLPVQTRPKVHTNHIPANLSPSQVTLLSILQKKMAEMDQKMSPLNETESSSDDWGNPLSDEDNKVPVALKATPQSQKNTAVNKTAALNMRELEGKVASKYQDASSGKSPTSNGVQSKHQYGRTFTVRPGTKNPITVFGQEES